MKPTFKIYARHFASSNWWPLSIFFSSVEEANTAIADLNAIDSTNQELGLYVYQVRQDGYAC